MRTGRGLFLRLRLPSLLVVCCIYSASESLAAPADIAKAPAPADRTVDFDADVKPILTKHCVSCHGPEKQKSDYRLDDESSALKGGSIGGAIAPGKSADSKLIHYVAGLDEDMLMPPKGARLSAGEISILRAWIDQGAKWGKTTTTSKAESLWSLAPLAKPAPPDLSKSPNVAWARTPIDNFILAKLDAAKMTPAPIADPRTLIRRVTFDLTGLPPTPAEVEAFVKEWEAESSALRVPGSELKGGRTGETTDSAQTRNPKPGTRNHSAYDRLVDRLLASPRYGERWARHWMDVVHFAETHGHDEDKPRPNAWPYRDYLIKAFNDDRPYARFIEEQIAGDALYPDDPQALVGTAMLAAGPWDQSSQMGIQDGTTDKKAAQYLDRDDMLTTAIGTFNSVTIHCARCHNHKFDPIPQSDYYALQAVFAGVDRTERSFDADPAAAKKRAELVGRKAFLRRGEFPPGVSLAAVAKDVAAWEEETKKRATWRVIDPSLFHSAGGATLTELDDHSILSGGTRPEKDTVAVTATPPVKKITAIKLEVLTDDSLAHKGPGRQDNGNLHLTQFSLFVTRAVAGDESARGVAGIESAKPRQDIQPSTDKAAVAKTTPQPPEAAKPQPIRIAKAIADFDQQGWTIAHALDGNPATAWGIYPQVGKSHFAVFELAAPLIVEEGDTITIVLDQQHGGGHLIGRARLSVTDAANSAGATPLPEPVVKALAAAPNERTEQQKNTLAAHVLLDRIERELTALPPQSRVYTVASKFEPAGNFKPAVTPREVHVLRRGDVLQPIEVAVPGALSALTALPARFDLPATHNEADRRAALARWISARDNVLTWRSIVNRVWHYHFARGLADSPSDLGRMGGAPSHPELLDYLTVTFRDDFRGSLKQLHKLIVTSGAYMQSSRHDEAFAAIDADNRLLWRMNRTRLDAEQTRDAVLAISGKLDLTMGGPSARQFLESKGVHETPTVDYVGFDPDHPANFRRSIYRFIFRTVPDPLMDTLDCPDASLLTAKRTSSVTALQALSMLNNRFMVRQYEHIAARLEREAPSDRVAQIRLLYSLALARPANDNEVTLIKTYVEKHGLANAVRVLLNSNEFMFIN